MKDFKISFSLADSRYFTAVRLAVGGVCAAADLDIDLTEDFKVSVTESCLILKNCGFKTLNAVFNAQSGVKAVLTGEGGSPAEAENDLSLALIGALVEKCGIDREGGVIRSVTLEL